MDAPKEDIFLFSTLQVNS